MEPGNSFRKSLILIPVIFFGFSRSVYGSRKIFCLWLTGLFVSLNGGMFVCVWSEMSLVAKWKCIYRIFGGDFSLLFFVASRGGCPFLFVWLVEILKFVIE